MNIRQSRVTNNGQRSGHTLLRTALWGAVFAWVGGIAHAQPATTTTTHAATNDVHVVELQTQKVGEAVHWMPEKVEVHPGQKVKFVVKHELEGGFDFHGFTIKELKIAKQVDRHRTLEVETTIPADLKPGTYKISCQFHPKHMPSALLIVKAN